MFLVKFVIIESEVKFWKKCDKNRPFCVFSLNVRAPYQHASTDAKQSLAFPRRIVIFNQIFGKTTVSVIRNSENSTIDRNYGNVCGNIVTHNKYEKTKI